jgi:hypothetical protein
MRCSLRWAERCATRGRLVVVVAALFFPVAHTGMSANGPAVSPATPARPDPVLSSGEDLLYEVRWSVFSIGTIRLQTSAPSLISGKPHHRIEATIDSYDGVPFVDFHAIISSFIDSTFLSHGSRTYRRRDERWRAWQYTIDTAEGAFFVDELTVSAPFAEPSQRKRRDTVRVADIRRLHDGLSILYFARSRARIPKEETIPVISAGKLGWAWFSFGKTPTTQEIDAYPHPIRVVPFEGQLTAKGMYGLTGGFKGWVSDDEASIPIRAELQVVLGKVNVELKEWKRSGWTPPH